MKDKPHPDKNLLRHGPDGVNGLVPTYNLTVKPAALHATVAPPTFVFILFF